MTTNRSFKSFILKTSFLFSFLGFFMIYWAATSAYDTAVKNTAIEASKQLANATFNSMFQIMKQGWNREQVESFLGNIESNDASESYQIQIYRGNRVEQLFGEIEQPEFDSFIQSVIKNKTPANQINEQQLRYAMPLLANKLCLSCHTNVSTGDLLGVVEIKQDLTFLMKDAKYGLLKNLIYLFPIPFILSMFVIFFLNRRINKSVEHLEKNIEKISKVSDLNKVKLVSTHR